MNSGSHSAFDLLKRLAARIFFPRNTIRKTLRSVLAGEGKGKNQVREERRNEQQIYRGGLPLGLIEETKEENNKSRTEIGCKRRKTGKNGRLKLVGYSTLS